MTWEELADEKQTAADHLVRLGLHRDAVSRIYYCVYSITVEEVRQFGPFTAAGWQNPPHSQVPGLIGRLPGYSNDDKREMKSIFKELFKKRVDADYRPNVIVDITVLKEVTRKARRFKELI